jgi:hypothetical protein
MRILSLVIMFIVLYLSNQKTDSPHGSDFKVSCKTCHSAKGWQLDKEIYSFDHNKTKLPLKGSHSGLNCRLCHISLVFSEAKSECYQCHKDIHQNTLGLDCARCHTAASWLVSNIEAIHRTSRFPLLGAHKTALCIDCHKSESYARYDVIGVLCIDCHRDDYNATTNPNHIQAGFSEDCSLCHPINSFQWQGSGFNHSFFPLQQAHAGLKCSDCHTSGNYAGAKPDCYSCHQADYNNTVNPNHKTSGFPTSCEQCHSTAPDWKPASYTQHDSQFFPIYSGSHKGKWTVCSECHPNTANYQLFDCKRCHADAHKGKNYTNAQCYACHPRGAGD